MSHRQLVYFVFPFILLIVLGIFLLPADHDKLDEADNTEPYATQIVHIATGAAAAKELENGFASFLEFINERLRFDGIELQPIIFPSKEALNAAINAGRVDLYLESAFPVYCAVKQKGMRPVARQWKNGVETYHSVILAKAGDDTRNLGDLAGKVIAMEDNSSSSSFSLPISSIKNLGLNALEISDKEIHLEANEVGYRFSKTDSVSIRWLLEGSVDSAAVSSVYFREIQADIGAELKVIHKTSSIPRYLLAVRGDFPDSIEQLILDVLLNLETYPEGQEAMASLWETRRFDLIPYENDLRERMFAMIDILSCEP